jgi:hypothetical protein
MTTYGRGGFIVINRQCEYVCKNGERCNKKAMTDRTEFCVMHYKMSVGLVDDGYRRRAEW